MRLILYSILILAQSSVFGCTIVGGIPRQMSSKEFKQELQKINSAYSSSLIGVTNDRVYLERNSMVELPSLLGLGPTVVIYWAQLSEFSSEEQKAFQQSKFFPDCSQQK